jgi:peptidoglycan glycosyltransferase
VFAPLGAKVGAKRLVAMAERFGFNKTPVVPAAKANTIPKASQLKDDLAVGASAIGQDKDQATPLGMASVAATIGNHGVWARPRVAGRVVRHRAVSRSVAASVRDMMIGVVRGGTGTAAALPGITVAGKTGTAELESTVPPKGTTGPKPPSETDEPPGSKTDAWFTGFAPVRHPKLAVCVLLVRAGAGGDTAAPAAATVLAAGLR